MVPWTGIQGVPATITAVATAAPLLGTVTITTAPVTVGGTAGWMTFKNGVLIAQKQAT